MFAVGAGCWIGADDTEMNLKLGSEVKMAAGESWRLGAPSQDVQQASPGLRGGFSHTCDTSAVGI